MTDANISVKSSDPSINHHLSRYYRLFKSNQPFTLSQLFDTYRQMKPTLHRLLDNEKTDVSVLNYALSRLPLAVIKVKRIILVQKISDIPVDISTLDIVSAPNRRRRTYLDRINGILYFVITSDSDIDDLLNNLIAVWIERQKLSHLDTNRLGLILNQEKHSLLGIDDENEWHKLKQLFLPEWKENFNLFAQYADVVLQLHSYSQTAYSDSSALWWKKACESSLIFQFNQTPVYFISSNLHSIVNLIAGYVDRIQDRIIAHIEKKYPDLYTHWLEIKSGANDLRVIDFLYYISSFYYADFPDEARARDDYEASLGIKKIDLQTPVPCRIQFIPVSSLATSPHLDQHLKSDDSNILAQSKAYIFNIEYPLGYTAYYLIHQILASLEKPQGIYIIGKAAILTGNIGDMQLPSIVFDERSNNIIRFDNIFNRYFPFETFKGSIYRDEKAITVYGTFLENMNQLQNYITSGFNIIEMESAPYLLGIHTHRSSPEHFPQNEIVRMDNLPFDLGIINYASDNPLTLTLGDRPMLISGVVPTYLASLTVLKRIIDLESEEKSFPPPPAPNP